MRKDIVRIVAARWLVRICKRAVKTVFNYFNVYRKIFIEEDCFIYRACLAKNLDISAPSSFRRAAFLSKPPAYPVRFPPLPTTLWHGIIIDIGLEPTAPPTAWPDIRMHQVSAAIFFAKSPSVTVSPYGISQSIRHTANLNGVPRKGAIDTSHDWGFFPSKYLSNHFFAEIRAFEFSFTQKCFSHSRVGSPCAK